MADEQRVPGAVEERTEKRKCEDFSALYSLDSASAGGQTRTVVDHTGEHQQGLLSLHGPRGPSVIDMQ